MKGLRLIKILSDFALFFALLDCGLSLAAFTEADNIAGFSGAAYILLCLATFAGCLVWKKDMGKIGYGMAMDRFKKGMGFIAGAFVISLAAHRLYAIENTAVPYAIIYLVSSVVLLGTLRNMEYSADTQKLNIINLRYSVLVMGLSVFLSIKQVRDAVISALPTVYDALVEIILYLISWILLGIGYVLQYLIAYLSSLISQKAAEQKLAKLLQTQSSLLKDMEEAGVNDLYGVLLNSSFLNILARVAIVVLVVFIIVKIYRRSSRSRQPEEEYAESKEFIKEERRPDAPGRAPGWFKAGKYAGHIRHYYQKFLRMCIGRGIDIKNSDTTLQISEKSAPPFDAEAVDGMRRLYVRARYGGEAGGKEMLDAFRGYFRRLKKQ